MPFLPEKASCGILPIFGNKVYLIKTLSQKPQDFGGKLTFKEAQTLTGRNNVDKQTIKYDVACRKALEEGGFAGTDIIQVIRVFNNPTCKYTLFLCHVSKKPLAVKAGTVVIEKSFGTTWNETNNFHFRVASTPGLCRFLANYEQDNIAAPTILVRTLTTEELGFLDV